jgi:hypothetical protein
LIMEMARSWWWACIHSCSLVKLNVVSSRQIWMPISSNQLTPWALLCYLIQILLQLHSRPLYICILDIFDRYCCFVALLAFRHFFWKGTQVLIRSILTTLCPLLLFCVYLPESCFPLFKYPVLYLTMFHSSVVGNISTINN